MPKYRGQSQSQVCDNRCMTQFVSEAKAEGAKHPSIKGEARDQVYIRLSWTKLKPTSPSIRVSRAKTKKSLGGMGSVSTSLEI